MLVQHLHKARISRGQRTKIAKAVSTLFDQRDAANARLGKSPERRPSTSTAMEWMRRFEESGRNIASLLSGHSHRKREATIDRTVEEAIEWALDKHYLTRGRRTLQYAYDRLQGHLKQLVERQKLAPEKANVSMATFHRRKDSLDPFMVLSRRYGGQYASNKLRVTMDGTVVHRAMQRYEVDHTLLNWVIVCDRTGLPLGRPTLTVVIDSYSGYVTGLYISFNGPGLSSVMNVIKNCIRPKGHLVEAAGATKPWVAWGVPDCLILDNGMEFHSDSFRAAAWELNADLEYCRVRTPWLKPRVERFFANLDYLPLESGRVFKPMANVLNIDPKKDATITLSRLCQGMVLFACDIHGHQPNSRTLELPWERFSNSVAQNPPPSLPLAMTGLDLIAAISKQLMVSQGGVEFYDLNYGGYDLKELIHCAGGKFKTLVKWDPDNLGSVYVRHPRTDEWITLFCTRPDYAVGLSWNQHRLLRQFTRQSLKLSGTVEHLLQAKVHLSEVWMEPLAKKNTPLDFKQARKFVGQLTSASTPFEAETEVQPAAVTPQRVLASEELVVEQHAIPEFETLTF
jgi:putative transposase